MVVIERTGGMRRPMQLKAAPKINPAAGALTPEEQKAIANAPRVAPNIAASVAARKAEMSVIIPMGLEFLNAMENKNIVPYDEYMTYHALFNAAELAQLNEDQAADLAFRWATRINAQQPVRIIDTTTPDNRGATYKGRKYKVMFILPAWLNKGESVNAQGDNAVSVAAECLANARSTSNPFDPRQRMYSDKLVALIRKGNAESIKKQNAERQKMIAELDASRGIQRPQTNGNPSVKPAVKTTEKVSKTPTVEEPPALDAEWEE